MIKLVADGIIINTKIMFAKESKFMKKIRILAVILAVLMLPLSLFIACDKDDEVEPCADDKHNWGRKNIISERGCETPEVIQQTCKKCGVVNETTKGARGHQYEDYIFDNNATCTGDGTKSQRCISCGKQGNVEKEEGSKLGHTFALYVKQDDFTETSVCIRCGEAEDSRVLGIKLDFEGEMDHPSYNRYSVFSAKEAKVTEGANSYLNITREDGVIVGSSEFGIVVDPRADILKGGSTDSAPYYIVEYKIRINKDTTKDLILLQGEKNGVSETFLTYDSENGTIDTSLRSVYTLKEADYGEWISIAVRLNDGKKEFDVYVNNVLLMESVPYSNPNSYHMGYDLDYIKVAMTAGTEVSEFDIDDFKLYLAQQPNGYENEAELGYSVYTLPCGTNVIYKDPTCPVGECIQEDYRRVSPTCESYGYEVYTCDVCGGEELFEGLAPRRHKWVEVAAVEATCTVAAYVNEECTNCGARNIEYSGEALGHQIDTTTQNIVEPTCFKGGYTEGVCVRDYCGIAIVIDEKSSLGHTLTDSVSVDYKLNLATCTTPQYASGKCDRYGNDGCNYEFGEKDRVEYIAAEGHKINTDPETGYEYVAPTCTEDGYHLGQCLEFEKCGYNFSETDKREAALGHVNVSVIQVVNGKNTVITTCTRCYNRTETAALTKVPTPDEMKGYINGIELGTNLTKFNFQDDDEGLVRGKIPYSDTNEVVDGASFKSSTITTKKDVFNDGNLYGEFRDYDTPDGKTPYMRHDTAFNPVLTDDFVYEISVRRTAGTTENLALAIGVIERATLAGSPNLHNIVDISEDGTISVRSTFEVYGKITTGTWTKIAVVIHANSTKESRPTFDLYIDGKLVAEDISFGTFGGGVVTTEEFPSIQSVCLQLVTKKKPYDKTVDIDEMYCYAGNVPVYLTGTEGKNYAGTVFTDPNSNMEFSSNGASIPYLQSGTIREPDKNATALGSAVTITNGANTVFAVENFGTPELPEYGLGVKIGATQPSVADFNAEKMSSVRIGDMRTYGSNLFETDVKIGEGTAKFVLFGGYKNNGDKVCDFVYYENGKLYTHDGEEICEITVGEWFRFAAVVDEYNNTYDVYINGKLIIDDKAVAESYNTVLSEKSDHSGAVVNRLHDISKLEYVIFGATAFGSDATYDVSYKNIGVYGRKSPLYIEYDAVEE